MHRLDPDTSGCLLLARNAQARARDFQAAFEAHAVEKIYLAVIDGEVPDDEGVIDLPLAKISTADAGWRMVADDARQDAPHRTGGGSARSATDEPGRVPPETGRTHQIRVHAREAFGCGDRRRPVYYGATARGADAAPRVALMVPRGGQAGDRRHRAAARRISACSSISWRGSDAA